MRAIEMAAIESGEVTGLELMERAGRGVVEAIFEEWPEFAQTSHRAVVLCGPGNNGGDGFVVARLLKEWGWEVEVYLYGDREKLPPDAKANYERWCEMGEVQLLEVYERAKGWRCDLLIDALFGTGLRRGLPDLGELFWNMEDMVDCFDVEFGHERGRPAIVAVDIPSGVCSDSGREFPNEKLWERFSAAVHLTVSFHTAKLGHYLADGAAQSGKTVVADIGLPGAEENLRWLDAEYVKAQGAEAWRVAKRDVVSLFDRLHPSWLAKMSDDHKFSHGHAFILTGSAGRTGAARLAARGALRVGTGLVTLGVPGEAMVEVAAQITGEMMREVVDGAALRERLQDQRINAVCLGPGLGLRQAEELVPVALEAGRATVLDADALTAFAEDPQVLFDMLHGACVLTPHGGEFARLFPDIAEKLAAPAVKGPAFSKVDATREAAKRAGCVVLYKGADTVIAAPDGRCAVHAAAYERAAPWLATAGAGDVLAGIITGLLARGFAPMQAAETGAWLHVEAARAFGPGLIAEDLPEMLPKVLRDLGVA